MISEADREVLSHYSVEDLESYLKEQENELPFPDISSEAALYTFISETHKNLLKLQENPSVDLKSDTRCTIFEGILTLLYGDDWVDWWNKLPC
jgi:hypothetical protein